MYKKIRGCNMHNMVKAALERGKKAVAFVVKKGNQYVTALAVGSAVVAVKAVPASATALFAPTAQQVTDMSDTITGSTNQVFSWYLIIVAFALTILLYKRLKGK